MQKTVLFQSRINSDATKYSTELSDIISLKGRRANVERTDMEKPTLFTVGVLHADWQICENDVGCRMIGVE